MSLIFKVLIWGVVITKLVFILIFFLWSKFGKDLKAEKTKEGANKVLTATRKLHEFSVRITLQAILKSVICL
jgi:hypothetical protein